MKKLMLGVVMISMVSACTPEEIGWWANATEPEQRSAVELIVREAAARYGVDPDHLVAVVRCESGLRPWAVNRQSGALGLGQHLPQYWPKRAEALGYDPAQWADPYVNADVTAWMMSVQGNTPWAPSKHCWN